MDATTKIVNMILSRPEDSTAVTHPRLKQVIVSHYCVKPLDCNFIVELNEGELGTAICLDCMEDVMLEADPTVADGGRSLGIGNLGAYTRHCSSALHTGNRAHRVAQEQEQKRRDDEEKRMAALAPARTISTDNVKSFSPATSAPASNKSGRAALTKSSSGGALTAKSTPKDTKPRVYQDPDSDVEMTSFTRAAVPSSGGSRKRSSSNSDSEIEFLSERNKSANKAKPMVKKAKVEPEDEPRSPMRPVTNTPSSPRKNSNAASSSAARPAPAAQPVPAQPVAAAIPTFANQAEATRASTAAQDEMRIYNKALNRTRKNLRKFAGKFDQESKRMIAQYQTSVNNLTALLNAANQKYMAAVRYVPPPVARTPVALPTTAAPRLEDPFMPGTFPYARVKAEEEVDIKPTGNLLHPDQDEQDNEFAAPVDYEQELREMESGMRGYRGTTTKEYTEFLSEACESTLFQGNQDVNKARKHLGIEPGQPDRFEGLDEELTLMPHQLLGVAWMANQEKGKAKGGILADQMGLGKTVQMIATMLLNRPDPDEEENKPTLILAPLALLEQWKAEIEEKCEEGTFKVLIYHGSGKPKKVKDILEYDVILTTLQTMANEWAPDDDTAKASAKKAAKKSGKPWDSDEEADWKPAKKNGNLLGIRYHRVVIDEAHMIRNKGIKASRAICRLKATYRWALTGTPIVNKLEDLYGLLRFLRIRPWFDWSEFRNHVVAYEKRQPTRAVRKAQGIMTVCMFRRKKDSLLDGKPLITLPTKTVEMKMLEFTSEERQIYESVQHNAQVKFGKYLRAGTVLKNYAHVLVLLLRLRQICNHPALITEDPRDAAIMREQDEADRKAEVQKLAREALGDEKVDKICKKFLDQAISRMEAEKRGEDVEIDDDCPMCMDNLHEEGKDSKLTPCGHAFCDACLDKVLAAEAPAGGDGDEATDNAARPCPNCRTLFKKDEIFDLIGFLPTNAELEELNGDNEERREEAERKKDSAFIVDDEDEEDQLSDVETSKKARGKASARKSKRIADSSEPDSPVKPKKKQAKKPKKKRVILDSDEEMDDFIEHDTDSESEEDKAKEISDVSEAEEISDGEEESKSRKALRDMAKAGKDAKVVEVKKMDKFIVSTKMKAMMDRLLEIAENSDNKDKTIVFSQWTSCLDLIDNFLSEKNIHFVRYQGDMSRKERDRAVNLFMRNKKCKVLLMSLRCGGVGLNLTRANNVISLDLAWSPAIEAQAFDRVHRLGQRKEVNVQRLIIENTVEDRLLSIQEKKSFIMQGAVDGEINGVAKKLTVKDLAHLFGLNANGEPLEGDNE